MPVTNSGNDIAREPVAVLGAGSWGTALAIQFARAGHPTRLWSRNEADAAQMIAERHNRRYLPDVRFPDRIEIHRELAAAVKDAAAIIVAVPSHSLRALLTQLKPMLARNARLAWATKGFELDTGKLPHQVAYDVLGDRYTVAVLSGPTFAREVGMGLPTAMTIASPDADFAAHMHPSLTTVHVDGAAVRSCVTPVSTVVGKDIVTLEGLGTPEKPHPIQKAFVDEQAMQCGFCLSGVILTAKAALDLNPKATDAQLRQALATVLCRCGTQTRMLKAINRYAKEVRA